MNFLQRMSRLIVAATFMAGSPGSAFAAAAIAPALASNGGIRNLPGRGLARAGAGFGSLPLSFERNQGQTDASVKFFSRVAGYNLYLTGTEAVMVLRPAKVAKSQAAVVVRMKLKGANPRPMVRGRDALPGRTNYFVGSNPAKWQTGVESFAKVELGQVYPGIDMVYYGKQGKIEHDFVVAPGANPGRILMGFEGSKSLRLDPRGSLIVAVQGGEVTYDAPTLYQLHGSQRTHVNGRFVLAGKNQVRFEVGDYIRSKPLVIDPALGYSSFLGGTVDDKAYGIVVDSLNAAYLTGSSISIDFNGTAGHFQAANGGGTDVFVTKINPAGTAVVWSTYYGGAGDDVGLGIALDTAGNVYVAGSTTLGVGVGSFPQTASFGTGLGGVDAFVLSLGPTGNTRNYAVVFGGPGNDAGNGIAVNAATGAAYVTGHTTSVAINTFPVTVGAAQFTAGGADDAFIAEFTAAGGQVYATYLGGTGNDHGNAITLDGSGNAYVTGECEAAFPITPLVPPTAFKTTITGSEDAFIAKLNPSGSTFLYSTYVGGSGIDEGNGIALDTLGNVYITGYTFSADFPGASFVTVGQTTIGTAPDAFVFKLKMGNGGGILDGVYATYLGRSGDDRATAIAVDGSFNAYVTGITSSGDFPMVGPIAGGGTLVGNPEAFVAQIGPTGGTLGFSTYLGGTTMTGGQGIALDSANSIYVTGWTNSDAATFPLATPFQAANAGSFDAFISKFGPAGPPSAACTITSVNSNSGFTPGGNSVVITGSGFNGLFGADAVKFDTTNATFYTVNASSTVITATVPSHVALGIDPLTVKTPAGSCSSTYQFLSGACGEDFFFPSPATGATGAFQYCMDLSGTAKIRVYNAIGDIVAKLEDAKPAGAGVSTLNTGRLAPGVYLYIVEKDYGNGHTVRSQVKKFVVKH